MKNLQGEIWIVTVAIGIATQYVGDVIGNLLAGKTGIESLIPTSSVGEYVAAGVTALIPGAGITGLLIRNVVSETVISVERHINGDNNDLTLSTINVVWGAVIDTGVEALSNKVVKYVDTKTSYNYSQYAYKVRKKKPNASVEEIKKGAQRSVRWGNRLVKGIGFGFDSVRSALPW